MNSPARVAASLDELTVIIVTFNSGHCLPMLGDALRGFPHVVLVDNASADDTLPAAARELPQAQVIANPRNLGFGAANNRGLAQVTTPWALLLNPDCELDAARALALLEIARAHPEAAMVAPQLLRRDASPEVNYRWASHLWDSRGPGAEGLCCVGFACGAALLLNMAVMRNVGFFDEGFFLYYEDDDLCVRAFEARHAILLAPQVRLTHWSRGSVGGKSRWRSEYLRGYHHAQSKLRFAAKYQGDTAARALRRQVLALALLTLPVRLLVPVPRHLGRLAGRIAGLWSAQPSAH